MLVFIFHDLVQSVVESIGIDGVKQCLEAALFGGENRSGIFRRFAGEGRGRDDSDGEKAEQKEGEYAML